MKGSSQKRGKGLGTRDWGLESNRSSLLAPSPPRSLALIIGASLTGLMTARVLSDGFEQVLLLDRDELPDTPTPRKGVPQASQYHGLMGKGYHIMRELYPQLEENLIADGIPLPDTLRDFVVFAPNGAGYLPRWESGIHIPTCSRTRLEWHIRRLTLAIPNITAVSHTEVLRLCADQTGTAVSGVQVSYRQGASKQGTETILADLVVDCSGRHSKIEQWLQPFGVTHIPTIERETAVQYATRLYHIPPTHQEEWNGRLVTMQFPENPRFGGVRQIEDQLWQVALAGLNGHSPPTDDAGFIDYAKQLASPIIYEAIKEAQPATPIYAYHNKIVRRRQFEKVKNLPNNLLILGDANTCYNPLYGQGMTSAALAVQSLNHPITKLPNYQITKSPNLPINTLKIHKAIAKTTKPLWQQAVQLDQLWANPDPANWGVKQRLLYKISRESLPAMAEDKTLFLKGTEIRHLLRPVWHGVNLRFLWRLNGRLLR